MFTQKLFTMTTILVLLFAASGCSSPSADLQATPRPATATAMPPAPTKAPLAEPTLVIATATEMLPSFTIAPVAEPTQGTGLPSVTQLTKCNSQCFAPAWLPDGTQISYFSGEDGQIHVVDRQGKTIRTFTLPENSFFGTWSPDGKQLAFTT